MGDQGSIQRYAEYKFGFGQRFFDAYFCDFLIQQYGHEAFVEANDFDALMASNPARSDIVNWVGSAVWRGARLRDMLIERTGPLRSGGQFLDVGCGFGGSLVAFSSSMAVHGIELDEVRLEATRALMVDHKITARVEAVNVLSTEFQEWGPFDVIMSENVVEHVYDVRAFIHALCSRLAPRGRLILLIPNAEAIQLVAGDPHYSLEGITLLSHHEAKAFFDQVTGGRDRFGMAYDVGDYYPLDWYLSVLRDCELSPAAWPDGEISRNTDIIEQVDASKLKCDAFLRETMRSRLDRYLTEARSMLSSGADFDMRFGCPSWFVVGTKASHS